MSNDATVAKSAAEFKRRVNEVVVLALGRFEQETGLTPSSIAIKMVNVTLRADALQRFVLGDITIGFDL